jgi:cellulose synthase/poly-beta-1,6-N-acetylglucosamine synthase-like glycosyltransferase
MGLFAKADLATGNIVEDLKLGIDLAIAGHPASFCADAVIHSTFPTQSAAVHSQRKRWEHGYLSSMMHYIPILLFEAGRRRELRLLAIAADLSVPPLALFLMLSLGSLTLALVFLAVSGRPSPALVNSVHVLMLFSAMFVIWFRHGRDLVSTNELGQLPHYIMSKLPIYFSFLTRRQTYWVKTDRDDPSTN